jgi:8-oxo-dGTP diphosphatase
MLDFKRHRGTVIVDTPKGILVVSYNGRTFYLPGGGAEKGESRKDAAIRELKEETSLETVACSFLFEYESLTNSHKVFLIESTGFAKPSSEIRFIDYFNGSNLKVSTATWEILEQYHATKVTKKNFCFDFSAKPLSFKLQSSYVER